jgi:hypothetical protein
MLQFHHAHAGDGNVLQKVAPGPKDGELGRSPRRDKSSIIQSGDSQRTPQLSRALTGLGHDPNQLASVVVQPDLPCPGVNNDEVATR